MLRLLFLTYYVCSAPPSHWPALGRVGYCACMIDDKPHWNLAELRSKKPFFSPLPSPRKTCHCMIVRLVCVISHSLVRVWAFCKSVLCVYVSVVFVASLKLCRCVGAGPPNNFFGGS